MGYYTTSAHYVGAVVVAQLVERSLDIQEFKSRHRQNFYIEHLFTVNCIE